MTIDLERDAALSELAALDGETLDLPDVEACCGGRYVLWMLHLRGPDDIYPALNYETAVEWADRANSIVPECRAVPAIWTGDAASHSAGLNDAIQQWEVRQALNTGEQS